MKMLGQQELRRRIPCRVLMFGAMVTAAGLTGCKPDAAIKQGQVIGDGTKHEQGPPLDSDQTAAVNARNDPDRNSKTPPVSNEDAGTVNGIIRFSGKPPVRLKIDMSQDPACGLGSDANFAEQFMVHDGKLQNIYVYIKSGPAAMLGLGHLAKAEPVVLDQRGCQYTPHVIAVESGGTVEFRNSDPTMHNIHTMPVVAGNQVIDVSQGPRGAAQVKQFREPEVMMPVRCNNHPWMNAFINVSSTPFFAVTGEDGKFSLHGLPPGTYVIAAVHEKMGEQTQTVVVQPRSSTVADFTYANR